MYLVTCNPTKVGNQNIKSYWCGGRQWEATTKVADSDMTPELLAALEMDSKQIGTMYAKDGREVPVMAGPGRIHVEHIDVESKPKAELKSKPKAE